ncbi:MAG TPA: hypothetical protein DCX53_13560 [Anaerolineae bacterium]|nr:hypothetical protein [Anaerolineae bacterium]
MDKFIHVIFNAHSYVRWLVLIFAAIAIFKFTWGWMRTSEFKNVDRTLSFALAAFVDLQALLGLVYFFWTGFNSDGFPRFRFEHGIAMFLALVCLHFPLFWKNVESNVRFRNSLFAVLASLILILFGISTLPGGLSR